VLTVNQTAANRSRNTYRLVIQHGKTDAFPGHFFLDIPPHDIPPEDSSTGQFQFIPEYFSFPYPDNFPKHFPTGLFILKYFSFPTTTISPNIPLLVNSPVNIYHSLPRQFLQTFPYQSICPWIFPPDIPPDNSPSHCPPGIFSATFPVILCFPTSWASQLMSCCCCCCCCYYYYYYYCSGPTSNKNTKQKSTSFLVHFGMGESNSSDLNIFVVCSRRCVVVGRAACQWSCGREA